MKNLVDCYKASTLGYFMTIKILWQFQIQIFRKMTRFSYKEYTPRKQYKNIILIQFISKHITCIHQKHNQNVTLVPYV